MQNIVTNPFIEYRTKLPLSFIKNNGQEDTRAHFSTNYKGRRFFFSSDRITSVELEPVDEPIQEPDDLAESSMQSGIPRNGVAVELSFVNANPNLTPEGVLPNQDTTTFIGEMTLQNGTMVFPIIKNFAIPLSGRALIWNFRAVRKV